ncbi:MAG: DUF4271 domain-containing protein [Hydrotalea flava]|uniref:DUF4271 domain-containing protein n=1 Tax=Hydrotalea TaxID=1004300 RepID=UPI0016AD4FF7|nr:MULTISPECIES: DUF4271 domain-containing protein [Hydrotalea]NIM35868.1 DUF4271 domain-containing protein [Hydrotalea flava]NIM38720.1 DUF4271 domain-containing protein [Hydrotalea flava]NIN03908.1 DUF4271 domain-containing protein [Hydrotalea flava]NIN15629.1 DUF4271 domain-containing protein [Hydrotalea flava]NIO94646.1 DUF4271 domain-containing protein [Hydrotalea flava]
MKWIAIALLGFFFALMPGFSAAQTDSGHQLPVQQAEKSTLPQLQKKITTTQPALESTMVQPLIKKIRPVVRKDSVVLKTDSIKNVTDSALNIVVPVPVVVKSNLDTSTYAQWLPVSTLPFLKAPVYQITRFKESGGKDELFYVLCGVLFYLGLLRQLFPKYFDNLFAYFFQTTYRQKQMREQLIQGQLSSLLYNILFFLNGGLYIALIAQYFSIHIFSFWLLVLYSSVLLAIIYGGKFLILSAAGWIFNVKQAASGYNFIVFLINKVAAIFLIPVIWLIAFSAKPYASFALQFSFFLLAFLWLYRFIISLSTLRRELKISSLHFFLYICAVEIIPVLCMYRLMFQYLDK